MLLILIVSLGVLFLLPLPLVVEFSLDRTILVYIRFLPLLKKQFSGEIKRKPKQAASVANETAQKEDHAISNWNILKLVLDAKFRRKVFGSFYRLVRRLTRCVTIRLRRLTVNYGSGEPAETAMNIGRFYAAIHGLRFIRNPSVAKLNPVFNRKCLEWETAVDVNLYLGKIVLCICLFLLELPFYRLYRLLK